MLRELFAAHVCVHCRSSQRVQEYCAREAVPSERALLRMEMHLRPGAHEDPPGVCEEAAASDRRYHVVNYVDRDWSLTCAGMDEADLEASGAMFCASQRSGASALPVWFCEGKPATERPASVPDARSRPVSLAWALGFLIWLHSTLALAAAGEEKKEHERLASQGFFALQAILNSARACAAAGIGFAQSVMTNRRAGNESGDNDDDVIVAEESEVYTCAHFLVPFVAVHRHFRVTLKTLVTSRHWDPVVPRESLVSLVRVLAQRVDEVIAVESADTVTSEMRNSTLLGLPVGHVQMVHSAFSPFVKNSLLPLIRVLYESLLCRELSPAEEPGGFQNHVSKAAAAGALTREVLRPPPGIATIPFRRYLEEGLPSTMFFEDGDRAAYVAAVDNLAFGSAGVRETLETQESGQ